jgi:nucleoid DNA-binding protein
MKIDVSKAIIDFLHNQKKVSIPGIGSFYTMSSQSTIGLGQRILNPPSTNLVFSDQMDDAESLIKYLQDEYDLSFAKADSAVKRYASSVLNNLLNLGTARIPGVGHLIQKPGEDLLFKPSEFGFDKQTYGLTPLEISPIKRSVVEKETKIAQIIKASESSQSNAVKQSSGKGIWRNIWPSLLLILLLSIITFLLAYWLNGSNALSSEQTNTEIVEDISNQSDESVTEEEISDFFESEAITERSETETIGENSNIKGSTNEESNAKLPADDKIDTNSTNIDPTEIEEASNSSSNHVNNSIADREKALEELADSEEKEEIVANNEFANDTSTDLEKEKLESGDADASINRPGDRIQLNSDEEKARSDSALLSHISNHPNLIKYKDVISWQALELGCVIVIGSFHKSKNAIKMRNQIINAGLQPHTSYFGDFTRIAIVFECRDHDLEGYIDTIRRDFNKDAWYLLPELEVIKKIQMN